MKGEKMELLRHELYKIFSKKYLFIILILMLCLVGIPNYIFASKNINMNKQVANYSKPYEGDITRENKEKLIKLKEEYKNKDKKMEDIYEGIYVNYSAQSRKRVVAISDILKSNNKSFFDIKLLNKEFKFEGYELEQLQNKLIEEKKLGKENTYDYKNKMLANKMYSKLSKPKFFYVTAWDFLFSTSSKSTVYIIVIMILLGLSASYSSEHKSKVNTIILSSKKGRREGVTAKTLAAIIYAVFIVCVCYLTQSIMLIKLYGIRGLNAPIQCLFDYICSPYNITIGELYIISFLTTTIGAIILVLIILLISNITKSSMITFFISSFIFIIPIIVETYVVGEFWWKKAMINLSVYQFIKANGIYEILNTINIFGNPIIYPYFFIIYALILIMLLSYALYKHIKYMEIS